MLSQPPREGDGTTSCADRVTRLLLRVRPFAGIDAYRLQQSLPHPHDHAADELALGELAGHHAAVRSWDVLAQVEGQVGAVLFGEGQDPAKILCHGRCASISGALQYEVPLADVVVDAAIERHGGSLEFAEGRLAAARAAASTIARIPPAQVARQVARVAAGLRIDPAIVTEALV